MCIAFVVKQTKIQIYSLFIEAFRRELLFIENGPAKSIPHTEKGRLGFILSLGKSPMIGCTISSLILKQFIHS